MLEGTRSRISFSLMTATLLLTPARFLAQAPTKSYNPPKTAWGDPDLEGIFTNATVTPFERLAEFAGKAFLTENEVAELEKRAAKSHADQPPREGETGTYNEFWDEPGTRAVSRR